MHACASLHACCTVRVTDGTLNRESMSNACLCIFACMLHRPGDRRDVKPGVHEQCMLALFACMLHRPGDRRDVKPGVHEQCMLVHLCMHAAPSGSPTGR